MKSSYKLCGFFTVILLYWELIFRFATVRERLGTDLIYILIFSAIYGLIFGLILRILPPRIRSAAGLILLLGGAFLFGTEFFVYRSFKCYYDLDTMLFAASDAMGSFSGIFWDMLLSADGLIHVGLLLLPAILWCIFHKRIGRTEGEGPFWKELAVPASGLIGLLAAAVLLVNSQVQYRNAYTNEYSFERAITGFGYLTGLRLDLKKIAAGTQTEGFELEVLAAEEETPSDGASGDASDDIPDASSKDPQTPESQKMVSTTEAADDHDAQSAARPEGSEEPLRLRGTQDEAALAAEEEHRSLLRKVHDYLTQDRGPVYKENVLPLDLETLSAIGGTMGSMDLYVNSLAPTHQNEMTGIFKGKNLILIAAEAFSGDMIDPELTPTLYRMAERGIRFTDYYQPASAGTTGGEFEFLTGLLPVSGGRSMKNISTHNNYFTMGSQLDRLGYFGKAYHNNDYKYYDRHITHNTLGYSEGFMGMGNGMEEYVTQQWPESDLEMIEGTLPEYIDHQPFNIYYMSVSGHSAYNAGFNKMAEKNLPTVEAWCEAQGKEYSDKVKAYLAANLELENAMTYLVNELEKAGIAEDTVICITADHFPYGLDEDAAVGHMPYLSELYGFEVMDYFERDHNRLILWCESLEKEDPITVDTPVSSIDILPTLSNLFGTEWDSRLLPGRDVFSEAQPLVFTMSYDWKTDLGTYYAASGKFVPASEEIEIPEGYVDRMKVVIRNKRTYMDGLVKNDYFAHLFGETAQKEDKEE